jgi:hypothetical protein
VKLKEALYALGLKPRTREYPFEIDTVTLPKEGSLEFARWRHPSERRKDFLQEEVDWLRTFLHEGDVAIDIGAHSGDSTLPIALVTGVSGCVFALEPNPYAFKVLAANARLNRDKTRIVPLMIAATPEDGSSSSSIRTPASAMAGGTRESALSGTDTSSSSRWRGGTSFA